MAIKKTREKRVAPKKDTKPAKKKADAKGKTEAERKFSPMFEDLKRIAREHDHPASKPEPKKPPRSRYREGDYAKLADSILHGDAGGKPPEPKSNDYLRKRRTRALTSKPVPAPEPEAPKVEVSVRNVYHDDQHVPALCFRTPGKNIVPAVVGDTLLGVRVIHISVVRHDKASPVTHGYGNYATSYTPERFAAHMKRYVLARAPITAEARTMLLPYAPDMPHGSPLPELPPSASGSSLLGPYMQPDSERPGIARDGYGLQRSQPRPGPSRTCGKELIRSLSSATGLPPEKVRAKLRAAGMRAPYTNEEECRKALGVKK